jgi:HEAT repeat protein
MRILEQPTPRAVATLARRAAEGDPYQLPFLDIVAQRGDERAMAPLISIVRRELESRRDLGEGGVLGTAAANLAAHALYLLTQKAVLADFWFVREDAAQRVGAVRTELANAPVLAWLQHPALDVRLRYVAAWLAGVTGERAAIPHLLALLGQPTSELTFVAAHALAQLGQIPGTAEALVQLLELDEIWTPSLLLELHAADPARVRPVLARALREGSGEQREAVTWIAAAAHDPALLDAITAMRDDRDAAVRRAAAAAVALARDAAGAPDLRPAGGPEGVGG